MNEINSSTVSSRFRFLEHVAPTYEPFSWKIAILNTVAFCLITGVDTYRFGLLRMQDGNTRQCLKIEKGNAVQCPKVLDGNVPRCPWGYWVLLCGIPLVLGNHWLSRSSRWLFLQTWLFRILSPYLFTVAVCWCVSWLNFRAPLPNSWQMLTFALVPLLGLVTTVIRYYIPHAESETDLDYVHSQARIKWIDENSNMWRTLAITSMIPTFVFIIFWYPLLAGAAGQIFTEEQRPYVQGLIAMQAAGIVVYVFLGPIYECFRKSEHIRNMLLAIKKEEA